MTENTTRVRDLSAELGVSNKELIQALREMGIHVKSHLAGVEEEDAEQLRALFKERAQSTEVVTKEIQPGMIVRRRRTRAPKKAKEDDEPEAETETVAEEVVPEEPVAAETPPEAAEVPPEPEEETFQDAVVVKTPAQIEAEAKAAAEAEEAARAAEAVAAETVEQAAGEAPEAETEAAEPAESEAAEAAEVEAKEEELDASEAEESPVQQAGDESAGDEEAEPAKKAKKKRKKKKEAAAGPQVTIISRPDPSEQPAPKPAAPARPKPSGSPGRRAAQPPRRPDAPPHPADTPGRKKRRKDRRVVEFPQHLSEEESRRRTSLQMKKKRGDQLPDGRGRGKRKRDEFDSADMTFTTQAEQAAQPLKAAKRKLKIDEAIRVSDMAHQMGVKAQSLIKVLLGLGVMATINQSLDMDTASLVAAEFGYETEKVGFSEDDYIIPQEVEDPKNLKPRPPVVTIMGHVDHGKTSLLDAIRESKVTSGEAGGITQHIGAYHVKTSRGELVFLDTPGHEAFTAMRARGAQVTDVVVLVVAADDGVMDQTREAINHSKAAGVPIIVAVNKMDKEGADPDRVKRELADLGLLPEDWGGETIFAPVSAKQRTGIDELLEFILLQAEILELKANPDKFARGNVVEAKLDKGRGAVATVLVREGTLNQGDNFVCGLYSGRVRAMFNDHGKKTKKAGPAIPVEVQGIEGVPEAGDEFMVVQDEKVARRIAGARQLKQREKELAKTSKVTLESFLEQKAAGETKILSLILKTDVQGSLEAVTDALRKLSTDEVKVDIIHGGTGAITETDILLASASQGIVIGFNVRPTVKVKDMAEQESVDIRFYDIIYKLVSDVKDAMSGMLSPEIREVYLGQAEVRQTFSVPKVGTIAGCAVADGKITRNAGVRLLRDGVVVYTGTISSLKRFKDDAKEVAKGYECGIGLENYNDLKPGDFIEAFEEVEEARTLD